MKAFYQKTSKSSVISNFPVKIGKSKAKVEELELTDEQHSDIFSGKASFNVESGVLTTEPIQKTISEKQVLKNEIKAKLESGTYTEEDIKEGLKLLL